MKTIRLVSILFSLLTILMLGMSFTFESTSPDSKTEESANFYAKPDFRISRISTPGGLCQGNANKIRVTVTNSGMKGYKHDIPVTLFVDEVNGQTKSYLGKVRRGFSGRDNRGQAVWFKDLNIQSLGKVNLRAIVNHAKDIEETSFTNNEKRSSVNVTKVCGQQQVAAGANLTVRAIIGSGGASSVTPIPSAVVSVSHNGQFYSGTTGSDGKVTLDGVPKGRCNIHIIKQGYLTKNQTYMMPTYNATANIILTAAN